MFDWSLESLQDQLASVADTTQIIFAHPHYQNQKRIIHCLVDDQETAYVSFFGDDLTVDDLNTQVEQHLNDYADMNIQTIILDDCDRAQKHIFNDFLLNYANNHKDIKLVVISRLVAYELFEDDAFRSRCQFVPVDPKLMLYDYAQRDASQTLVEVRSFGSGIVYVNGRQIEQWDGILPRQLFFYLADRGMTTRNDIFATFWPNLNTREATNVFHVTKRKITDIISESFTKFGGGFYRISPNIELSYDVIRFSEYIQSSVICEDAEEAINLLETAIALYRAAFLNAENTDEEDNKDHWVSKRREELHEMYGEALLMLAEYKIDTGDEKQALGYYLSALRILNHHEEIVAKVMKLYHDSGQTNDALALYDWIEHNLEKDYGIKPTTMLQEIADGIRPKPVTV